MPVLLALGVSGLLPRLGPWLHGAGLVIALAWLAATLWSRRSAWRLPSWDEAKRRLERDSNVGHRPLESLADRPAIADPMGMALWQAHRRRLAGQLAALRPRPPQSDLPRRDRFAWRAGALLALAIAVAVAGPRWAAHLRDTLQPRFAAAAPAAAPVVDLWLEPPSYTGHPPIFAPPAGGQLRFPLGSKLIARVSNANDPVLYLDAQPVPLAEEASGQHALTLDPGVVTDLSVSAGGQTLAAWPVTVIPDQPPTAQWTDAPSSTPRQALRLDYTLRDDYGLAAGWAEMRLAPAETDIADDRVLRLPFPLSLTPPAEVKASAFHDLTPHQWAGRKVLIALHGRDGAGQEGRSDALAVELPERRFSHPVARQIIAARKDLDRGAAAVGVARSLGRIASLPERFNGDVVVYLALSSSFHRLRHGDGPAARTAVRDMLWETALRLEDGTLPGAERDLRAAQQALQEALARDADAEEIRRLVEELRAALRRFAMEMARRADEPMPPNPAGDQRQAIAGEDLEKMLDRIRDLADSGARDAAQDLLSQMQQMLESVRQAQRMTPQQRQQAEAMTKMLNQLQEMQRRQQSLIDRTFRQNQQAQPAPTGPPDPNAGRQGQPFGPPSLSLPTRPGRGQPQQGRQPGRPMPGLAVEQDRLRLDLGDLMRDLGERFGRIPDAMQQAEQAMRAARDNLQQGAGRPALDAEGEALENLRRMGAAMSQQLANRLGTAPGPGRGPAPGGQQTGGQQTGGREPGARPDPLGRDGNTGQASETGPRIPGESVVQRARRIRDLLYDRSADPDRPVPEQDYLRRLLDQF